MRTGKYKIGANACLTMKRAYLIIVSLDASENSVKEALKLSRKFNCKIIKSTVKPLSEYAHKDNAKIMAISDKNFANLIMENLEKEFTYIE